MSVERFYRCDRCMVVFDPLTLNADRFRVTSPILDGQMDLCGGCVAELETWVRAPLESDDAIDFTTGPPA